MFETAGSQHTPVTVGQDDVVTLNIVMGDWNLIDDEGRVLAMENWKSVMQRYLAHCEKHGIEPVDISSFSV